MKKLLLVLVVVLFSFSVVSAAALSGQSITLLSVSETEDGSYIGGTAELTLELRPGTGNVFIDSSPLTKVDTQAATRIAKDVACEFSGVDCTQFDYFYIMRANSPIIGGPSAGGATALLTLATLEGIELPTDLAMTGAISSGGVITAVSGIREKALAAIDEDMSLVLVPEFAVLSEDPYANIERAFNVSINVSEFISPEDLDGLQTESTQVTAVTDVREALAIVTSYDKPVIPNVIVPEYYAEEMMRTAQLLCDRTTSLLGSVDAPENSTLLNISTERFQWGQNSFANKEYYAAASYCYTANLRAQQLVVQDLSQEEREDRYDELVNSLVQSRKAIDGQDLRTFADLETYGIVKERLLESQRYLDQVNLSNISAAPLAFATERYFSAQAWSGFFGVDQGTPLQLDQKTLRAACLDQLQQVDVRLNYLRTFVFEGFLSDIVRDQEDAYVYLNDRSYPLCLFKASQAQAQADLFISTSTLFNESVDGLIVAKLERTQELIAKQGEVFPILGYSYFEYADALRELDSDAAVLFSEYALVFSDLSAYFPVEKERIDFTQVSPNIWLTALLMFIGGFIAGILFTLILVTLYHRKHSKHKRKRHKKKP